VFVGFKFLESKHLQISVNFLMDIVIVKNRRKSLKTETKYKAETKAEAEGSEALDYSQVSGTIKMQYNKRPQ